VHGDAPPFAIEFYELPSGDKPVLRWINEELTVARRRTLGYALWRVLQQMRVGVCGTEFGRQLGGGLFESRVRAVPAGESTPVLLRVFCHATADSTVLLLEGYDKGADPSPRRQRREIDLARRRLHDYQTRYPSPREKRRDS
jgi:hypothetical protein